MSVHVLSLVYATRLGGALRKAVALKLADCADDDGGSVFPSLKRLSQETEVSKSTAQRAIRDFLELGILELVREGGSGPGDTTEYRFNLDKLTDLPRSSAAGKKMVTQTTKAKSKRWSPRRKKVVTQTQKGGQALTTEPSGNYQELRAREDASEVKGGFRGRGADAPSTPPASPERLTSARAILASVAPSKPLQTRPASRRALFTIRKGDQNWDLWIRYLEEIGRDDVACEARSDGYLNTQSARPPGHEVSP